MNINTINSSSRNSQTFGMAKLTNKGVALANDVLGSVTKYADSKVYQKKNMLKKLLNKINKDPNLNPASELSDFFANGKTEYALNNQLFIKKQILPIFSQMKIKSFLKADSAVAKKSHSSELLTEKGKALTGEMLDMFDQNIANERVSSKKGRKILDLVKPYVDSQEISKRVGIISDKYFAK